MISENKDRSYHNQLIFRIAAAVAALALGGYFFMRGQTGHTPVGPPEKITIAYSTTPDSALAQVAQAQGYYLQEGLDVIPQKHPYGKIVLDAVLEGKVDFKA